MRHKPHKKVCHKVGYKNRADARQALKEFGRARGAVRYYRCPFHGSEKIYHLTSRGTQ